MPMIVPTWPTPDTGLETCFLTVRQPGAVLRQCLKTGSNDRHFKELLPSPQKKHRLVDAFIQKRSRPLSAMN